MEQEFRVPVPYCSFVLLFLKECVIILILLFETMGDFLTQRCDMPILMQQRQRKEFLKIKLLIPAETDYVPKRALIRRFEPAHEIGA